MGSTLHNYFVDDKQYSLKHKYIVGYIRPSLQTPCPEKNPRKISADQCGYIDLSAFSKATWEPALLTRSIEKLFCQYLLLCNIFIVYIFVQKRFKMIKVTQISSVKLVWYLFHFLKHNYSILQQWYSKTVTNTSGFARLKLSGG